MHQLHHVLFKPFRQAAIDHFVSLKKLLLLLLTAASINVAICDGFIYSSPLFSVDLTADVSQWQMCDTFLMLVLFVSPMCMPQPRGGPAHTSVAILHALDFTFFAPSIQRIHHQSRSLRSDMHVGGFRSLEGNLPGCSRIETTQAHSANVFDLRDFRSQHFWSVVGSNQYFQPVEENALWRS